MPIGTDYFNGLERAKLIAQKTDVLVAPILMPGNSPYHMEFPGTITLSSQTIQQVYFEAAQSLMRHGFKRFLLLNSHGGNQIITRYIADRINQETEGIAVELGDAAAPFLTRAPQEAGTGSRVFDRHGGVGETSSSLYIAPKLVNLEAARRATLTMPDHLQDAAGRCRRRSDRDARIPGGGVEGEEHGQGHLDTRDDGHGHVGSARSEGGDRGTGPPRDRELRAGCCTLHRTVEGTAADEPLIPTGSVVVQSVQRGRRGARMARPGRARVISPRSTTTWPPTIT